ncbi:HAD family hydrolase, partial [[Eubacterium] cellulosolvens]
VVKIAIINEAPASVNTPEKIEFVAQAFIFDKDGTLLSHDHFIPIMQKRVELLQQRYDLSVEDQEQLSRILGLDPVTSEIIPHGTMFIARKDTQILVEVFLAERGFKGSDMRKTVAQVFEEADEQVELVKYIRPLPGVPELLANLKQTGAQIAIATHDNTAAAERQLRVAKLIDNIDLIIGLDYSEKILHKPSPSMLLAACERFEIDPDSAVVVGDSFNDVLMGKNGGAGLSIAVLSGEHVKEDFKEYDAIVDSLAKIEIID